MRRKKLLGRKINRDIKKFEIIGKKRHQMNIKIAILTTETLHHVHFVRTILNYYKNLKIFCETGKIKNILLKLYIPLK